MRAAADVEQDAVGRIKRNKRRVTQAAFRDGIEQAGVGGGVFRLGDERGMHGARLRQREPRAQPESLRRSIDRGQQVDIAALAVDDERRRSIAAWWVCSLPPCGGGVGRGVNARQVLVITPLPVPPPQGGRGRCGVVLHIIGNALRILFVRCMRPVIA